MKVKDLIEKLKECDPNADIFYGRDDFRKTTDEESSYELYDFDIESHKRVKSYRSASSEWSYHENVVVLVYD